MTEAIEIDGSRGDGRVRHPPAVTNMAGELTKRSAKADGEMRTWVARFVRGTTLSGF